MVMPAAMGCASREAVCQSGVVRGYIPTRLVFARRLVGQLPVSLGFRSLVSRALLNTARIVPTVPSRKLEFK